MLPVPTRFGRMGRWTFCPFCVESRDFLTRPGPAIGGQHFGAPGAVQGLHEWGFRGLTVPDPKARAGRIWGIGLAFRGRTNSSRRRGLAGVPAASSEQRPMTLFPMIDVSVETTC